jgi:uncharacterized membrane protein
VSEPLAARLDDLTVRLAFVETRLAAMERATGLRPAETAVPAPTEPAPAPRPAPRTRTTYSTAGAPPRPASPPPPPPPAGPTLGERLAGRLPEISPADLVGARALAWVGGAVTLLGIVFFFVLAVNRGWVSEELRVVLGALVSAGLFLAGIVVHRRYGNLQAALAAAGASIGGAFATLVAASALYDLVPAPAALLVAGGIAAAGVALALAWNAQLTAVLGLAGAMLGPPLIESVPSTAGAAFVALGLAAAVALALRRGWLETLAVAGVVSLWELSLLFTERDPGFETGPATVAGVFAILYLASGLGSELGRRASRELGTAFLGLSVLVSLSLVFDLDAGGPAGPLAVLAAVWLAFLAAGIGVQLLDGRARLTRLAGTVVAAGTGIAFAAVHARWDDPRELGLALLVVAGITAAPLVPLLVRFGRGQRDLATLLGAASLAVLAVAGGDLLDGERLALAWAAQGALLAWIALLAREPRLHVASVGYLVLAAVQTLAFDAPWGTLFEALPNPEDALPSLLFVATAIGLFALAYGRSGVERRELAGAIVPSSAEGARIAAALAGGFALYAASFATLWLAQLTAGDTTSVLTAWERGQVAVTALWAAVGLALVVLGVTRGSVLHVAGLGLLGLAAVKLAGFDADELGEPYSAWALFAVATALLAAGYAYALRGRRVSSLTLGPSGLHPLAVALTGIGVGGTLFAIGLLADGTVGRLDTQGLLFVLTGLLLGGLAAVHLRSARDAATLLWTAGLVAVVLGLGWDLLDGSALVLAWSALGAGLAALARVLPEDRLFPGSAAVLGLAALHAVGLEARPDALFVESGSPAAGAEAVLFVSIGAFVLAALLPDARRRAACAWIAGALGVYAASLGILGFFEWETVRGTASEDTAFSRGHTAVSAFWVVVGLGLFVVGLLRARRPYRLAGLALFGLALAKIFLYDLANLSSLARAGSFLAVGSVLLVAAFLYQRLTEDRDGVATG